MKKLTLFVMMLLFATQPLAFGGDIERGALIYQQRCTMCHGPDGRGNDGMAVDFREQWYVLNKSDAVLGRHIRNGYRSSGSRYKAGPMPSQAINDQDLRDVLDYMRDKFMR